MAAARGAAALGSAARRSRPDRSGDRGEPAHDPPVLAHFRTSLCPVSMHGHELPAHSKLMFNITGANRDPQRFPDPESFRLRSLSDAGAPAPLVRRRSALLPGRADSPAGSAHRDAPAARAHARPATGRNGRASADLDVLGPCDAAGGLARHAPSMTRQAASESAAPIARTAGGR